MTKIVFKILREAIPITKDGAVTFKLDWKNENNFEIIVNGMVVIQKHAEVIFD